METGLDRRDMIPHPAEPRDESLPYDLEYAVRPDYINANFRQLAEAIGCVLFTGLMCDDGGYYGNSISTECRLTLPSDFTEVGDVVHIGDGTREWQFTIAVEDALKFSDSDLCKGSAGTSDYDQIKDNLMMWVVAKSKLTSPITKDQICLGALDKALHGDDLRISTAIATTIKDFYDDFYESVDGEHKADGSHSDGIIGNANLDKDDVLISQGNYNKVKNGGFNINGALSTDFWEQVGTPTLFSAQSQPCDTFPDFNLKVTTDALDEGLRQKIIGLEKGVPIRLCVYLKGDTGSGEDVKIQLQDDYGNAFSNITLTSGYVKYYLTYTPQSQCNLYVRIVSNTASTITWYVALVTVCMGDVHTYPEKSPEDAVRDAILTKTFFAQTTIYGTNQIIAQWTLERDLKIVNAKAYVITAVSGADLDVRLTNGTDNYDTTISAGNNAGENTGSQEFSSGDDMEVIIIGDASRIAGTDLLIVYQYRTS